jgi:exonuclease SbcD
MKILHTSDWHLGQNFMGQSREEEHRAFFSWLIEVIESELIDVLIVSGDIFDTGTPPNYALELYYNFLKELAQIETLHTTIVTAGNHDSVSTLKAPKQLLEVLNVHVITLGDDEENEVIEIAKNNKLQAIICAVPFLRDSVIRESISGQTISEKEKIANSGIKAYYEKTYKKALKLKGDNNIPIIATGHLTTVGSRTSESERDIYIGGTLDIGGDYLGGLFDYVALGHLHRNQMVGCNHVRYSGSPIPLSFSEAHRRQKINIVDFDGLVTVEALEVPLTRELKVLRGKCEALKRELKAIEDKRVWIEVHLKEEDNPLVANQEIRALATTLELTLLAVKIDRSEKQIDTKEMQAVSLDALSVEDVFEKRIALETLESEVLKNELWVNFTQVVQKVQNV